MAHAQQHKSQNAFDTASYLRLAYNMNNMDKPRITKQQMIDPKFTMPAFLTLWTPSKEHLNVPHNGKMALVCSSPKTLETMLPSPHRLMEPVAMAHA